MIKAIYNFLDNSKDGMRELQSLLTSIPAIAPESGGTGEFAKAEALQKWLRAQGFANIARYDSPDSRVPDGKRPNIVATLPGRSASPALWIMSHLDVVPEGERSLWNTDPFVLAEKDGKVYGRGVEDNQQATVSSIFAVLAFIKLGIVPERTVKLLFIADEEVGSAHGIQYLLKAHTLFAQDDLIVVPDGGNSHGDEMEIAEKNINWLKVITTGKQCHGSRPDDGANAFLAACDLALRLHKLEETDFNRQDPLFSPPRSTISPTKKEANVPNVNTIPGEDVFYCDVRLLPTYSLESFRKAVAREIKVVEAAHKVTIRTESLNSNESKATAADAPVVLGLKKAIAEVLGVEATPIGIGGGTVAAHLRNSGYSAVVWTRIDETAHQPNEYSSFENMIGDAKVFAHMMY